MAAAIAEKLLTAEEYFLLPDDGTHKELVRGRIVRMNMPKPRHGQICARIVYLLERFQEDHPLGHVLSNDTGVVTDVGTKFALEQIGDAAQQAEQPGRAGKVLLTMR